MKTSQRFITRKYNETVKHAEHLEVDLTNRVNCYKCSKCEHITKTKDVDKGVTPFMFHCESCGEYARSSMYRDVVPFQEPTIEWYRPSLKETLKMRSKPALLDHVLNGGLLSRNIITPDPPEKWYQKCESCDKDTDFDTMECDSDANWFCPECWEELAPVMKAEYEELVSKGEIDPDEDI